MSELRALTGLVVVLCGPSGAGKSTLVAQLREALPEGIRFSVSYTTRPKRTGEVHGQDYFFVTPDAFAELVAADAFLEHATVHTNSYGTHQRQVEELAEGGAIVILDIDVQGAAQVRATGADVVFVFVLPPSVDELETRLRGRATDADEVIARRLAVARAEMSEAGLFDYVLVNGELDVAVGDLLAILRAEQLRRGKVLTVDRLGLS